MARKSHNTWGAHTINAHTYIRTGDKHGLQTTLVHITEELRRTADVIEMIESEPALIGALMDSGDWRKDEITQLRRHVTDLRVRIGLRA